MGILWIGIIKLLCRNACGISTIKIPHPIARDIEINICGMALASVGALLANSSLPINWSPLMHMRALNNAGFFLLTTIVVNSLGNFANNGFCSDTEIRLGIQVGPFFLKSSSFFCIASIHYGKRKNALGDMRDGSWLARISSSNSDCSRLPADSVVSFNDSTTSDVQLSSIFHMQLAFYGD